MTSNNIVDIGVALVATILIVFAVVRGKNYGHHQQQRHRVQDNHEGEEVVSDLEAGAVDQSDSPSIWSANDDDHER